MANQPNITFVICTYNRADYLSDTLDSLLKNKHPGAPIEILVVDNNSSDRTPEVVQQQRQQAEDGISIRYVKEKKQGLSHARNRGIREARFPIVIFLDDDIRAPEHFISAWQSFFGNRPDARAAGGRIRVQFDDPRPEWMSHFLLPLLGHHDLGNSIRKYKNSQYPFGGNMAFKKDIFEEYGTFNPDLGRKGSELKASEEKEFFQRFQKELDIYYVPDAMLYHRVNRERLTEDYIRRQAVGLGESIALRLRNGSRLQTTITWIQELFKMAVTLGLFLPYTLALQWSKAVMLLKFRKWIAEGYFSANRTLNR